MGVIKILEHRVYTLLQVEQYYTVCRCPNKETSLSLATRIRALSWSLRITITGEVSHANINISKDSLKNEYVSLHARPLLSRSSVRWTLAKLLAPFISIRDWLKFKLGGGWFGRDGKLTKFLETVSLLGYFVAAWHYRSGNYDHAGRAFAKCTNSTILTAGTLLGGSLGGPLGAMSGAALSTPLAIMVEMWLKDTLISDPALKAEFEDLSIDRVARETLLNTLAAGIVSCVIARLSNALSRDLVINVERQLSQLIRGASISISGMGLSRLIPGILISLTGRITTVRPVETRMD